MFNWTYEVLLENQYFYDDEYIEEWGVHGDMADGKAMDMEHETKKLRMVSIPASELCDVFEEGARPDFVKLDQALRCYNTVMDHLEAWVQRISGPSMNQPYVPWDDLFALDRLAEWLFPLARNQMATEVLPDEQEYTSKEVIELHLFGHQGEIISTDNKSKGYLRNVGESYNSIMTTLSRTYVPEEYYHALQ